jgi:hypothetical protein
MKNYKLFLILSLTMSLLLSSCSKDEESNSETKNFLLGSWKKNKVEKRINSNPWEDITVNCNLDDVEEYESNSDWALFPGTNTCNSESIVTGNWSLGASDTKIIYTYDAFSGEYESSIESISASSLVLTQNTGDLNNTQFRFTYTKL